MAKNTFLYALMTTLGLLGFIFLETRPRLLITLKKICNQVQNEKGLDIKKICRIRSDHGTEFENAKFSEFYDGLGISHEFSTLRTPQQNGVVERKN